MKTAMRKTFGRILLAVLMGLGWTASISAQELPRKTSDGFEVPQPGRKFVFPRDHGSHPGFKIEWWYVTGHLFTEKGRRFGYQATFFRRAAPLRKNEDASTDRQLYLAHMAVLDAQSGTFLNQERINRGGWDAGSSTTSLDVFNGPWRLAMTNAVTEEMSLNGGLHGEAAFHLRLKPSKPLVVFGTDGISRKGADPTASSHYLTFTRLETTGTVQLDGESFAVSGLSWMDHEISSSQLDSGQAGWDWTAVQFDDGTELMAYVLRRKDGGIDRFSTLARIDRAGRVSQVPADKFDWKPVGRWRSAATGASYPATVRLTVLDEVPKRVLTLVPLAPNQELTGTLGGIAYWEGACRVQDATGAVIGSAFLELTGYTGNLSDQMR
jgi:predicted secreted hydrolase